MTQNEALKQIAESGPLTISQLPASRNTVHALRDKKLIKRVGQTATGQRGRPAVLYSVSAKGERTLARA